ncbi:AHH domain-containing protein [Avibacterium sp. 21-594]|uniref:AHH domain-containing protein n=1 Tax=Avibacterium sp. 21-594 TaxID=2911535 RepID=UPI0022472B3C|nr:AHH domain-containing protein [Avibacterium sp. 21-594]MCW9715923.1 AHH domain-containing protein [Avibacterium sp. 21-594]
MSSIGVATQYDKANNQVLTNALIPEIRNNLIVKSGSDVLDGLSSSGRALLNHPLDTTKTLTQNIAYSASECLKSLSSCIGEKWSTLTSASKDILRTHYNQSDVNYLYGKDMSVETTLIPLIRGGSVVAEFAPVAKAGSAAVKGASILGQKATVAASEKITRGGSLSYVTGNELGNNYRILSLGIVEGPNGGKLINTEVKDAVTNSTIYQRISSNGTLSNQFMMIDDNGLQINVSKPLGLKNTLNQKVPIHHICTDKNCISTVNGGPWTPRFEKIFDGANLSFNDVDNKVKVVGHQGPHPEKYHKIVYDRLYDATRGLSPKSTQYEEAVRSTLKQLKIEISDSNTELNKLVIGVDR